MKENLKIITVDSPKRDVLTRKTQPIAPDELHLALEIENKLLLALKPLMPAAGLAAPQIGISKSVFIYSYNREPENLELVINPAFTPVGSEWVEGWEGCFSILLGAGAWQLARVPRYEKINASYLNRKGEKVGKILEGFAAKVFQHEYDHLQGIVNVERSDATIKHFTDRAELERFLQSVKKEDSTRYKH